MSEGVGGIMNSGFNSGMNGGFVMGGMYDPFSSSSSYGGMNGGFDGGMNNGFMNGGVCEPFPFRPSGSLQQANSASSSSGPLIDAGHFSTYGRCREHTSCVGNCPGRLDETEVLKQQLERTRSVWMRNKIRIKPCL